MNDGDELLKAIADLGGLDPFSTLEWIVSPNRSDRLIDTRSPFLHELLSCLSTDRNQADDNRVKQILWDARAATLLSTELTAEVKSKRLEGLDEIGRVLFHE